MFVVFYVCSVFCRVYWRHGRKSILLSCASSMTVDEIKATTHVVMPERSVFASMLNRRSPHNASVGIEKNESYVTRREATGLLDSKHIVNVLSYNAAKEVDSFADVHRRVSNGWFGGCEADQCINVQVHASATLIHGRLYAAAVHLMFV